MGRRRNRGEMAGWGVIGAVSDEIAPFIEQMEITERRRSGAADLYLGTLCGQQVAVARSGVGKVNAAAATLAILLLVKPASLITLGSAGGIGEALQVGDVVVSSRALQHDVGTYYAGEFRSTGMPMYSEDGIAQPVSYLAADVVLVREAIRRSIELGLKSASGAPARVLTGTVATGDSVLASSEKQAWLRTEFNATVVDMESAAVAQVAASHGVPWIAVRAVSDGADSSLPEELVGFGDFTDGTRHLLAEAGSTVSAIVEEYHTVLKLAAHNAAAVALALICG